MRNDADDALKVMKNPKCWGPWPYLPIKRVVQNPTRLEGYGVRPPVAVSFPAQD